MDTDSMLDDLVDLDRAKCGESKYTKVMRELIREAHRKAFPEQWNGSYYKHYSQTA